MLKLSEDMRGVGGRSKYNIFHLVRTSRPLRFTCNGLADLGK